MKLFSKGKTTTIGDHSSPSITTLGKVGFVKSEVGVFTYQVGLFSLGSNNRIGSVLSDSDRPMSLKVDGFNVLAYGTTNNEPYEVKEAITSDKMLPELIEKQVRFLMGKGWSLYKEVKEGKSIRREYLTDTEIESWLDNWKENGCKDSVFEYLNKAIREYYYLEGVWTKWRMSEGMSIGKRPVAGLEVVPAVKARFATKYEFDPYNYEDGDFKVILVGGWRYPASKFKVYPRFDYSAPLSFSNAISYSKNASFGEEVYSFNTFYKGIKEWLKGTKLTPKYINSYLENSLAAKFHVIIPQAWLDKKAGMLEEFCSLNATRAGKNQELIKVNDIEIGTEYHEGLLVKYTEKEIEKFTQYMSGPDNQAKVFTSMAYRTDKESEQWKIEEIPQKYKEFMEALINYDKRADAVILAAKGLDPSISNVTSEGIFSKSGADSYYNYLIYITNLHIPEKVVCADLNFAIKLNFPQKYAQGVRIGFYIDVPARQEEVSPNNRMSTPNSQK